MKELDELQAGAIGRNYGLVCKTMFEELCKQHPFRSRDKILQEVLENTTSVMEQYHWRVSTQRTNSP